MKLFLILLLLSTQAFGELLTKKERTTAFRSCVTYQIFAMNTISQRMDGMAKSMISALVKRRGLVLNKQSRLATLQLIIDLAYQPKRSNMNEYEFGYEIFHGCMESAGVAEDEFITGGRWI